MGRSKRYQVAHHAWFNENLPVVLEKTSLLQLIQLQNENSLNNCYFLNYLECAPKTINKILAYLAEYLTMQV